MRFYENIKTLLSDKRGRAIVKLGFYIIFMAFVIIYVQEKNNRQPIKQDDNYASKATYQATIKFLDKQYKLQNNLSIKFFDEEKEYTVINNIVYDGQEQVEYDFYFWNLTPTLISNLVSDKKAFSETKYQDSSIEKTYYISLLEFLKKFDGKDLELEEFEDKDITIKIKKQNNEVVNVFLDLTNYYYFFDKDKKLEVDITY